MKRASGISNKFPYNIAYKRTIYNSVGGSGLKNLLEKDAIKETLKQALYLGVRDCATYQELKDIGAHLTPDSAIILSDIWAKEVLKFKCRPYILSLQEKKYFVFQLNGNLEKTKYKKIIKIIRDLSQINGINIVLLPLGKAMSHGDLKAMEFIDRKTNGITYFFRDLTLQESTWILANSCGFVGTSLHGNIVSLSYGKRSILIAYKNTKNWFYWNTWLKNSNCLLSTFEMLEKDIGTLNSTINTNWIEDQKKLVYKHFERIIECIKLSN